MNLEKRRLNIQRELDVAEMAMAEVRQRWGFGDLEERSYPHPVTARLMRLQQERDSCLVQIAQLRAQASNLEGQAETAEGKANLKKAQDNLVVLTGKLEELQKMRDEAAAKKKDLDAARVQYRQRASIRDERKRMLDSLKEQIERLKILYDDPQTPEVRE
jgi:chromosome segregation ATPase